MELVLAVTGTNRHTFHNVVVSNVTTDLDFPYRTRAAVFDTSVILLKAAAETTLYWKSSDYELSGTRLYCVCLSPLNKPGIFHLKCCQVAAVTWLLLTEKRYAMLYF